VSSVHPTAIVEDGAQIGEDTRIWHFVHVRSGARIGKKCNIGKGVYVDTDVVIGDMCKIQNFVSLYKGVVLEDGVFVGPSATFTNDPKPRAFLWDETRREDTLVKKGASIGANATIMCGITIGEYAMIGAGSVVTKNVPPHALVYGNPARIEGFVCPCGEKLEEPVVRKGGMRIYICKKCGTKTTIERDWEVSK